MGCLIATYSANEVLMAVGITVVLVLALTIFALQTKIDFTAMGGVLLVALVCLLMFGLMVWIFPGNKILNIVYASIGAFIFGCYIIFDTQMMMGGKHKYSLDPEEYIFASLNLYLDIINLFMFILSIIGNSRN
jgi:FtsH-binding integral membrane protein